MQRRTLILATGAAATTGLAGCLGSADEGDDPGGSARETRTITVTESGEAAGDPDLAIVQVGVESSGEDADTVRDDLAERAEELRDALVEYGLDEDNITTDQFRIRDQIDEERMREDGVEPESEADIEPYIYYLGTHSYRVEVEEVDDAGEVVDVAVDAGADNVGRIEFTLSEEKREELRAEAIEEAIGHAETEAEFVAGEVDTELVEALHVDTDSGGVSPVREEYGMDDVEEDADPATELDPGDVTVSASVEIEYVME